VAWYGNHCNISQDKCHVITYWNIFVVVPFNKDTHAHAIREMHPLYQETLMYSDL